MTDNMLHSKISLQERSLVVLPSRRCDAGDAKECSAALPEAARATAAKPSRRILDSQKDFDRAEQ